MRAFPFLLMFVATGCAAPETGAPSLAPRPAEAIDPRVPVPGPVLATEPAANLVRELEMLVSQAVAGDETFRPLMARAQDLAEAAGVKESESWVGAQQALSAAVAARDPVTRAAGDLDSLGAQRIQQLGGIGAADLKAIQAAATRVGEIDNREAASIAEVQARLAR